jgi:hypothetical protein
LLTGRSAVVGGNVAFWRNLAECRKAGNCPNPDLSHWAEPRPIRSRRRVEKRELFATSMRLQNGVLVLDNKTRMKKGKVSSQGRCGS